MNLRLATYDDVSGIMEMIKALIPILHAAGNLQWDERYPNPQVFERDIALGHLWVATIEEKIAGVVATTMGAIPGVRPGRLGHH